MFHTFPDGAKHEPDRHQTFGDLEVHPAHRSFSYGQNYTRLMSGHIESPLFRRTYLLISVFMPLSVCWNAWECALGSKHPQCSGIFRAAYLLYVVSSSFCNARISWLTVIFFFNGSLSGVRFLSDHPLSRTTALDIITNAKFPFAVDG